MTIEYDEMGRPYNYGDTSIKWNLKKDVQYYLEKQLCYLDKQVEVFNGGLVYYRRILKNSFKQH